MYTGRPSLCRSAGDDGREGRTGHMGKHGLTTGWPFARSPGSFEQRWRASSPSRGVATRGRAGNDAITQHLMQREYGRLCGVRDLRRASWVRRHDQLFIFSGPTRTVATKANKPVWACSISWRGHGPSISAPALPISPNSTGSPPGILSLGSGSGLERNSKLPSTVTADTFPRLESYGCLRSAPDAVRPRKHIFSVELDAQTHSAHPGYLSRSHCESQPEPARAPAPVAQAAGRTPVSS
ncbi:hypothetical protein POSPLADRAFT_1154142 [Postia placenta MAD-698-R-SB12]|uniref:Uncharacterized protein n=1 Tax=Postia placenta MAD-698-R-SB12 TaxID=670580 RepID=A0A1X6MQ54_9APHY|nr:hypothetical protein POSPLADRAFT_1154142 [Postia placenta MAD-698-R-SB12]OSX58430.1 hypothetical protein POSPLADRAFT_1154142 [Postia placenta MAD-698-R-SB12]